jgi:hypothetical protein
VCQILVKDNPELKGMGARRKHIFVAINDEVNNSR